MFTELDGLSNSYKEALILLNVHGSILMVLFLVAILLPYYLKTSDILLKPFLSFSLSMAVLILLVVADVTNIKEHSEQLKKAEMAVEQAIDENYLVAIEQCMDCTEDEIYELIEKQPEYFTTDGKLNKRTIAKKIKKSQQVNVAINHP